MIKRIFKFAAFIVSVVLLVSGSVSIAASATTTKSSPIYSIITNGNAMKLKAGDIVSLKNGTTIPAELKRVKVRSVSKTTKVDIYDYLRESLPASKFQHPYTIFLSLTTGQIKAYDRIYKNILNNKVKIIFVSRNSGKKA